MRFYKQPHAFYAGVDLHARSMFIRFGLAAAPVTEDFEREEPAEAAHLQSTRRTEPMRCRCRSRVCRGLEPAGTLPAKARYSSEIELAVLLGLHVARRGFWDATSPKSHQRERLGSNAVAAWEHEAA